MKNLVIKLGALGDVVIATSLIRRIQVHYPHDELTLLTTPAFAGLFAGWPGLRVVGVPRKGLHSMWRALRWLRAQRFDRVFDLQSNDRSAILVALSGVRMRVGNRPGFPYTHHPAKAYRSEIHIFERMNQVLASAGIPPGEPQPVLPSREQDMRHVVEWLAQHDLAGKRFAVLHAGASPRWPSKRWPWYRELALELVRQGVQVVWVGAEDDRELNRILAQDVGIDATGSFSIIQLAELGRHAAFAVTNDSGPMHILSASGIPVFAFFGPTRWHKNHALNQGGRVLRHTVPCSPCSLGVCPPDKGHACLRNISVNEVLERLRVERLLSGD
ncbi:MAG: glycosyltransferase family 9 protein [Rhodocyclaceae bacterium]